MTQIKSQIIKTLSKAGLVGLLMLNLISSSWASGLCTGFFITKDGYIGTAAHCYGKKLTVFYISGKQVLKSPAEIINYDKQADIMLLKIHVKAPVPFFTIAATPATIGSSIAYIGYPNPDLYGYYRHTYRGKVYNISNDIINMNLWGAPGASGSGVFNSDSSIIGVLTLGFYVFQMFDHMGARPNTVLIRMAYNAGAQIVMTTGYGTDISQNDLQNLYDKNKDKVVLIGID